MRVVSSQWSGVRKSVLRFALCAMLFALCPSAEAQQTTGKIARIAYLGNEQSPSARGAADEVRAGDQSENSEADRTHDSAERAGESR
jgi:hypothetical protein